MKTSLFRAVFLPTVILAGALFPFANVVHAANPPVEIASSTAPVVNPVLHATVNLYCRLKSGNKIYSTNGSGVFVSERGVILTNAHVAQYFLLAKEKGRVRGTCSVRTGSPAKETYSASILYLPPKWLEKNVSQVSREEPKAVGNDDFALLYITGSANAPSTKFPTTPMNFFATTSEQTIVSVSGYPSEKLNFKEIRSKLMAVTATSSIKNVLRLDASMQPDVLSLSSSAAAAEGVSGGPIVNDRGELIGIIYAKSSAKENPSLRGITISYINRAIYLETKLALPSLLTGDFALRASTTRANISEDMLKQFENAFRKKK